MAAKRNKRVEAMRQNPKTVRPDELDVVLRGAGFTAEQRGSSHKVYRRGGRTLLVPQRTPFLKENYVKDALDLLEEPTT